MMSSKVSQKDFHIQANSGRKKKMRKLCSWATTKEQGQRILWVPKMQREIWTKTWSLMTRKRLCLKRGAILLSLSLFQWSLACLKYPKHRPMLTWASELTEAAEEAHPTPGETSSKPPIINHMPTGKAETRKKSRRSLKVSWSREIHQGSLWSDQIRRKRTWAPLQVSLSYRLDLHQWLRASRHW